MLEPIASDNLIEYIMTTSNFKIDLTDHCALRADNDLEATFEYESLYEYGKSRIEEQHIISKIDNIWKYNFEWAYVPCTKGPSGKKPIKHCGSGKFLFIATIEEPYHKFRTIDIDHHDRLCEKFGWCHLKKNTHMAVEDITHEHLLPILEAINASQHAGELNLYGIAYNAETDKLIHKILNRQSNNVQIKNIPKLRQAETASDLEKKYKMQQYNTLSQVSIGEYFVNGLVSHYEEHTRDKKWKLAEEQLPKPQRHAGRIIDYVNLYISDRGLTISTYIGDAKAHKHLLSQNFECDYISDWGLRPDTRFMHFYWKHDKIKADNIVNLITQLDLIEPLGTTADNRSTKSVILQGLAHHIKGIHLKDETDSKEDDGLAYLCTEKTNTMTIRYETLSEEAKSIPDNKKQAILEASPKDSIQAKTVRLFNLFNR
ncbi:MAG: hypothetical protein RLZ35_434 [Pseudomonadota bacterium]